MFFHLDVFRGENLLNDAFFIDEESGAENAHVFPPAHAFLAPHAERFRQFMGGVGDERERQLVLFDELPVGSFAVHAGADDGIPRFLQVVVAVAQAACLAGAAGRVVFRVEIKGNLLSFVVAEADGFPVFIRP